MEKAIFVSACLLGDRCAYDGLSRENARVVEFCKGKNVVKACPEMLGGLGCPRETHEIVFGDGKDVLEGRAFVLSRSRNDRTPEFIEGAEKALSLALKSYCHLAVLRDKSPSCGVESIYSGKFDLKTVPGQGVTSSLFKSSGIRVVSDTMV